MKGQFMLGSNHTFLVAVHHDGKEIPAVYKPARGERPLWDFPDNTLAQRETAAYLVSESLGFHFVPFTTLRDDGPYGPGSLQQYVEYDPEYHYFNFSADDKARLQPVALFDLLVNNADRKGSHVFFEIGTKKLWAIDHGICFHAEDKLRTVIWDFAGQPIPGELLSLLSPASTLPGLLEPYLDPAEIAALQFRAEALLASKVFPRTPKDRRAFPYPPI
ncbi:MAG: SCO1664 family protein [Chloroflexi bacterium]|nr:SCO1664 family protein [Chloroflexota bacterium]